MAPADWRHEERQLHEIRNIFRENSPNSGQFADNPLKCKALIPVRYSYSEEVENGNYGFFTG
jgi:hypothetical protein